MTSTALIMPGMPMSPHSKSACLRSGGSMLFKTGKSESANKAYLAEVSSVPPLFLLHATLSRDHNKTFVFRGKASKALLHQNWQAAFSGDIVE